MSDPASRILKLAMKWKKTSGATILAALGAIGSFAWTQWTGMDARVSKLQAAQTQAYTDSAIEKQSVINLSNNFSDFRNEYRSDMSDVRRALMIPPPHSSTASYKEAAGIP